MDEKNPRVKLADALRAEAAALEAQATAKRAQADALVDEPRDELLDVEQALERYGVGREAIRAAASRGELEVSRGARGKLLVRASAIEAWIRSRPYKPSQRRTTPAADLDAWEAEADRALGGRR